MDLYSSVSFLSAKNLTREYSSSFGISSKLFNKEIRKYIYAIYGLVRIADEVVDTYRGADAGKILDQLEADTYSAIESQYSTNPIIHAFALTAHKFSIGKDLIAPFFDSMRLDLNPQTYDDAKYKEYIYGSAEVVGLMCLKVFCQNNKSEYENLSPGAKSLGSAYQKVNFLRDVAADFKELGRIYFPGVSFKSLDEEAKAEIIKDIEYDFEQANQALVGLPKNSRLAVTISYVYYRKLLEKLKITPVEKLKLERIRISDLTKLALLPKAYFKYLVKK